MLREKINETVLKAVEKAAENSALGQLKATDIGSIIIEKPKNPEFGDFAVNLSSMARFAKMPPVKIAETVKEYIDIEDTEMTVVAGFINFKSGHNKLNDCVKKIILENKDFGRNNIGNAEKVMLEYVSANPTGPLHIGHGRWAGTGSALASLLKFSGYEVYQEFYINDAGNQINNLGRSLWLRILNELGIDIDFPKDETQRKNFYPGDYLIPLAKEFIADDERKTFAKEWYTKINKGDAPGCVWQDQYIPPFELVSVLSDFAKALILEQHKQLLKRFRVDFDNWFPETSLHEKDEITETLKKLDASGKIYEKDGAIWFKSSEYGDDQDRVVIKLYGAYTYLTADIAYHYDKINRGFDRLINIWGADHHGYVARIKASIEAMGNDSNRLEILLGQLVNLVIDGEQVRMGKRRKMVTLEELIDEVGIDGTRYWMIMRDINTALDFDVELAKSCSDENPIYYSQYAHARACSILRTAVNERPDRETGEILPALMSSEELEDLFNPEKIDELDLNALWKTEDKKELEATRTLILRLESFQNLVISATKARAPYMIARYILDLAKDFHYFYTFTRVLSKDEEVRKARLSLVLSTRQVLGNAFDILRISAPEKM